MQQDKPALISTAQAARIIGVTDGRIRQYIQEGLLPAFKIGNRWVIHREDAEQFEKPLRGRPWHKET